MNTDMIVKVVPVALIVLVVLIILISVYVKASHDTALNCDFL